MSSLGLFIEKPLYFAALLFLILVLSSELGFRLGRYKRQKSDAELAAPDAGALTGIVYALLDGVVTRFSAKALNIEFEWPQRKRTNSLHNGSQFLATA